MKIEFPLLSILSVAFLLFFAFQGGQVELYSFDVNFSADSERFTITVDPAFVIWSDQLYPDNLAGETFGNVAVVRREFKESDIGNWIQRFETNHIIQYRALGWWVYPAKIFLPIDPMYYRPQHWDDPSEADSVEWLPPPDWTNQWHFISFSVDSRWLYFLLHR